MNTLPSEKRKAIISELNNGLGIRATARKFGVSKITVNTIAGSCVTTANNSIAFGRRRRWWINNCGMVPDGMVVDASCGDPACDKPEHCYLRYKIDTRTTAHSHAFSFDAIQKLEIGQSIGVAIPPEWDPEIFARKMRGKLVGSKTFMYFRWSVRLRDDGILAIRKMGRHGDGLSGPSGRFLLRNVDIRNEKAIEPPRFCVCGCGEQVINGILIDGHKRKQMALCPGCGDEFEYDGRVCCSDRCKSKFEEIREALSCL